MKALYSLMLETEDLRFQVAFLFGPNSLRWTVIYT